MPSFLGGIFRKENSVLLVIGRLIYRFQDLIDAKRERERQRARINRHGSGELRLRMNGEELETEEAIQY